MQTKILFGLTLFILAFFATANESLETLTEQLTLKNAQVYSQKYITGGQPNESDFKKLAEAGIKSVINLRGKGEFSTFNEQEIVEKLGMKYIHIPIASANDIHADNIAIFHETLSLTEGGTLVHCASGNRVGAFFALESYKFKNKTSEQALSIGKKTGLTRLENRVIELMQTSGSLK